MLNTIDKPILRIPEKPTPVFNDRPRKMLDTMRPRMCKITSKITAVNRTRWEWVNRCSKVQPVGSVAYLLAETHFLSSYYHFDSISLVKQALIIFLFLWAEGITHGNLTQTGQVHLDDDTNTRRKIWENNTLITSDGMPMIVLERLNMCLPKERIMLSDLITMIVKFTCLFKRISRDSRDSLIPV